MKPAGAYIIVSQEGITYKTLVERIEMHIKVLADNSFYVPYEIPLEGILEVWHHRMGILPKDYKLCTEDFNNLKEIIGNLKMSIQQLE